MNWTALLIVLRESLEAMLILGILTAVAIKSGQRLALIWILGGALGGALLALAGGVVIYTLPEFLSDTALNYFELLAPLVASVMIVHVIWNLRHQAREMNARLKVAAGESLSTGDLWSLATIGFLAVAREGFETVLFLGGELLAARGAALVHLLTSALVGFILAYAAYKLFQTGLRRIGMIWFFRVTMVLLLITAAGLAVDSYRKAEAMGFNMPVKI